MTKTRSGLTSPLPSPAPKPESGAPKAAMGLVRAWLRFWFTPTDPVGLHVLRLASGLLFLAWMLPLAGHLDGLFGLDGWFDRQAYREASRLPGGPPQPFTWSILYLCGTNAALLAAVYWTSIAVLSLFTLGVWTRLTAVLSWLIVASFTASPALGSDGDSLLLILALYLMAGYACMGLGDHSQSMVSRMLGAQHTFLFGSWGQADAPLRESRAANVALRLLQVHFAIVVCVSGLHKLQFGDWWAGLALWYPMHPALEMTAGNVGSPEQVTGSLWYLGAAAYGMLAWQIGFPGFAWRPRWRPILLGGALIGWLGCAFIYGVPVFGPALFVSCLSYVTAREWRRLFALLSRVPAIQRVVHAPLAAAKPVVHATR